MKVKLLKSSFKCYVKTSGSNTNLNSLIIKLIKVGKTVLKKIMDLTKYLMLLMN